MDTFINYIRPYTKGVIVMSKSKRKKKIPLEIRLDAVINDELRSTADARGITLTSIVEKALRKELKIKEEE